MITTSESNAISDLNLEPVKLKLMHKESGEGWSNAKADAVEIEYRRFLYLMKLFPNEETSPLVDVDTFWHYHILDTRKYAADCQHAFGYFLHHFPYVGLGAEGDDTERQRAGARMQELYEATFGEGYPGGRGTIAQREAGSEGAAWCGVTLEPGADAAWCGVTAKPAGGNAWCGVAAKLAWCGVAASPVNAAAWCGVAAKPADATAWCGVTAKAADATAWCGVARPADSTAWCGVTARPADAIAWCGVTAKPANAAAWCGATAKPANATAWCGVAAKAGPYAVTGKTAAANLALSVEAA